MTKVNYSKVEQELNDALRSMYVKKLLSGEPSVSKRAVAFYGMDQGPRPKPSNPVIDELELIEQEEKELERQEAEERKQAQLAAEKTQNEVLEGLQSFAEEGEQIQIELEGEETQKSDAPPQIAEEATTHTAPPTLPAKEIFPTIEDTPYHSSPLLLLRKLVLWMKKKRVTNIYTLLGTTEEEFIALKTKIALSPEEEKRILDILEQGKRVKVKLLKKLGLETDEQIIADQYKKQNRKKNQTRDTWIPL